jgi:putative ABC transport system permease protein
MEDGRSARAACRFAVDFDRDGMLEYFTHGATGKVTGRREIFAVNLGRYVFKNVLRNKRRTALTVLSIGFSLFLLIALWTVLDMLVNPPETDSSILRLAVRRSTSLAEQMPLAYGERLKKVPHVVMVMPFQWFGGYYREPQNMLATLAADHHQFFEMFPEIIASPEHIRAWQADRRAALVGEDLLKQYGWKIGQTVTIIGNIYPTDLELHIVGTYTNFEQANGVYVRWDYLKEALGDNGKINTFWLKADSAASIPGIIDAVDGMFRNSPAETKTETEKAFRLGFVSMLGNVRLIIGSIAVVVVFTMLLVVASTMAMTIRERMREVAILKAIGYPRRLVLGLIVGEGLVLALCGFVFACVFSAALGLSDTNTITQGFIPRFQPPAWIYASTLGVGLAIGLIAGVIPGLDAARLTITEAMRRLE